MELANNASLYVRGYSHGSFHISFIYQRLLRARHLQRAYSRTLRTRNKLQTQMEQRDIPPPKI